VLADVGDRMFLAGAIDVNYTPDYNDDRQITTAASKTWKGINRPRFAVCRLINDVSVEGHDSVRWRVPPSVVGEAPGRVRMALSGAGAIHQHTGCLLIFSLRPANPIQFATFERRSATTSNAPCCDREKSATARSFCLIYCVFVAYLCDRVPCGGRACAGLFTRRSSESLETPCSSRATGSPATYRRYGFLDNLPSAASSVTVKTSRSRHPPVGIGRFRPRYRCVSGRRPTPRRLLAGWSEMI